MSTRTPWHLDGEEAGVVLARHSSASITLSVISITCNWGPPVPHRFGSDNLDVWFAADESLDPERVTLYGTESSNDGWFEVGAFTKSGTVEAHGRQFGLFHFSGNPVEQFVVCLIDRSGGCHYDNNGGFGVNYRILRYVGLQISCVKTAEQSKEGLILVFPELMNLTGSSGVAVVRPLSAMADSRTP